MSKHHRTSNLENITFIHDLSMVERSFEQILECLSSAKRFVALLRIYYEA